VKNIQFDISKQGNTSAKTKTDDKTNQGKGVQCNECEGFGHIRSECATYLKKQKKGLSIYWSDEDNSENELENVAVNHVSAMTGVCDSDAESCDDELTYEVLASTYKDLYASEVRRCA
jgi:hypothetical protein